MVFESQAQIKIERVKKHKISFRYTNNGDKDFNYLNPSCFFRSWRENNKKVKGVLSRNRANLRSDTLFIYLHDIDFNEYRGTVNPKYKSCKKKNIWGYRTLKKGNSTKLMSIMIRKRIKFKYLSIYYSGYFGEDSLNNHHRVTIKIKDGVINEEFGIQPLKYIGETDPNFSREGRDYGLGR